MELYKVIKTNNLSLSDFILQTDIKELNNGQLKLISGIDGSVNEMLSQALENIEKHFSFVGILEYYDVAIQNLMKMYGWNNTQYASLNKNKLRPNIDSISKKTIKLIEELNQGDIVLYNKMKTLFVKKYCNAG